MNGTDSRFPTLKSSKINVNLPEHPLSCCTCLDSYTSHHYTHK